MNRVSGMPINEVDWNDYFSDVEKTCLDVDKLLLCTEIMKIKPVDGVFYDLIVLPQNDGDVGAHRKDILNQFLLIH